MDSLAFKKHNHKHCIEKSISEVELMCENAQLILTPVRKRVLEILLKEHQALGAYKILDILREDGFSSQPPIAYRALDFLVSNGFAHKIERLNAFIACAHVGEKHSPAFLICRLCASVAETLPIISKGILNQTALTADFVIEEAVLEAEGICPNCKEVAIP